MCWGCRVPGAVCLQLYLSLTSLGIEGAQLRTRHFTCGASVLLQEEGLPGLCLGRLAFWFRIFLPTKKTLVSWGKRWASLAFPVDVLREGCFTSES